MSSDFAVEMARMVYRLHLTDAQIHEATGDNTSWMQQQIDAVRADPDFYKPMANMWTMREFLRELRNK